MKTRNSRWMKWIIAESARTAPPLPYARGARRAAFIARRKVARDTSPDARARGA